MGVLIPGNDMTAVRRTATFFLNNFEVSLSPGACMWSFAHAWAAAAVAAENAAAVAAAACPGCSNAAPGRRHRTERELSSAGRLLQTAPRVADCTLSLGIVQALAEPPIYTDGPTPKTLQERLAEQKVAAAVDPDYDTDFKGPRSKEEKTAKRKAILSAIGARQTQEMPPPPASNVHTTQCRNTALKHGARLPSVAAARAPLFLRLACACAGCLVSGAAQPHVSAMHVRCSA